MMWFSRDVLRDLGRLLAYKTSVVEAQLTYVTVDKGRIGTRAQFLNLIHRRSFGSVKPFTDAVRNESASA
jgi:hypothetical protein